MVPFMVERPINFTVKAVKEGEIRVQPRTICAGIVLGNIECVLFVIDVTDLQIAINSVEDFRTESDVLDFRSPDSFQPHGLFPGAQCLAYHCEHWAALEHGRPFDSENDSQHVLAVE